MYLSCCLRPFSLSLTLGLDLLPADAGRGLQAYLHALQPKTLRRYRCTVYCRFRYIASRSGETILAHTGLK